MWYEYKCGVLKKKKVEVLSDIFKINISIANVYESKAYTNNFGCILSFPIVKIVWHYDIILLGRKKNRSFNVIFNSSSKKFRVLYSSRLLMSEAKIIMNKTLDVLIKSINELKIDVMHEKQEEVCLEDFWVRNITK